MPGFQVRDLGQSSAVHETAPSNADYYYVYTWEIAKFTGYRAETRPSLIHLQSASTPTFTANIEKYTASSVEYKWAKSVTWEDIKVSFYDTYGLIEALISWRSNIWSPYTGLKPARSYKDNTILNVYLPSGEAKFGWNLIGSWPSTIRSGELTYTESNVKICEITVTYDWAEEVIYDVNGNPRQDVLK